VVARQLQEKGLTTFHPVVNEVHKWSDRRKVVESPLFNCYVFVKIAPTATQRLHVLQVNSVLGFVGTRGQGIAIPDEQIDAVRTMIDGKLSYSAYPFLKVGQRVRIRSGALNGLEGILISRNGDRTLVISVDAIQRSMAVKVEGYEVEPV
jgi:transcription antitermination factor NusG